MHKLKIAIVTWVCYNNYGTLLQMYALQKCTKELGYDNTILDDTFILANYKKTNPHKVKQIIKRFLYRNYNNPYFNSYEKMSSFKKRYIYSINAKIKNLNQINKVYDLFICGSDQIWSPFDYNFYSYYWLDFVDKVKISYAPSLGTTSIADDKLELIKTYLKSFSFISVREECSSVLLTNLIGKKVEWVCDPTFLFNIDWWNNFCSKIKKNNHRFILCYFLENREWYFNYARKVSDEKNLDIILIPSRIEFNNSPFVSHKSVGPIEFVSLFRDASYVLTDSYHGSIFSIIYNKQFAHFLRFKDDDPINQNIRIQSLFSYLGLRNIIDEKSNYFDKIVDIDYDYINKKISAFRSRSLEFLKNALQKS